MLKSLTLPLGNSCHANDQQRTFQQQVLKICFAYSFPDKALHLLNFSRNMLAVQLITTHHYPGIYRNYTSLQRIEHQNCLSLNLSTNLEFHKPGPIPVPYSESKSFYQKSLFNMYPRFWIRIFADPY